MEFGIIKIVEGLAPLILFGSEVDISQPARLSDVRFV
jgi:hypothetical protein